MITERYAMLFGNDAEVKQLTHRILREGCVVLPDFFDQATKDTLTKYSQSLVGKERYAIKLRDGTPAMEVARSPEFMRVFDTIHKARCKIQNTEYKPLDPKRQAISLPLKTADADTPPTPFHFDDSYINAVFAMKMPPTKGEGNLLVYKNLRTRIRPLLLSKIVARLLRHISILRAIFRPEEIDYREGGLHLFFGDITFHAVPDISSGERITFTINAQR